MSDNEDSATILLSVGNNNCHDGESDTQIVPGSQRTEFDDKPSAPAKTSSSIFLFISASMAALGGLLFGYDIGIISTALPQLTSEFSLHCNQQEMVVSLMLIGALFASLVGGIIQILSKMICYWYIFFCLQAQSSIKLGAGCPLL